MKFSNNFPTWKIIYMNKALSASYLNTCIYVIYISYTCIEYHRVLNFKKIIGFFFRTVRPRTVVS